MQLAYNFYIIILFEFDFEASNFVYVNQIQIHSWNSQYWAMRVRFLAQGNNEYLMRFELCLELTSDSFNITLINMVVLIYETFIYEKDSGLMIFQYAFSISNTFWHPI